MSYFDVTLLYFESPPVSITFCIIDFSFCFNVSHIRTSTYNSRNSFILLNSDSQHSFSHIYNSRNSFILLNMARDGFETRIYNSRNSFILLNDSFSIDRKPIYNSRNSFILLNSYTVNIHNRGAVFLI